MPPCAVVAQKVRSVPVHCASTNAHLMIDGRKYATIRIPMIVRIESPTEENRFLRIQAVKPVTPGGGVSVAAISARTKVRSCFCIAALPLDQRHLGVEPIHKRGCHQAEAEIDHHPNGDDFNRLPCLVKDCAADRNEIWVSD